MPFTIVRQSITRVKVDAVVNAANRKLRMGGGVCGAIFKEAGAHKLQEACDKLSPIQTGEAVLTPSFDLSAKYIIHVAGPVYDDYTPGESERLLRLAYANALKLAVEYHCKSIAFPLISGGIYGYPKTEALKVATEVIADFLEEHELDVILTIFDKAAFAISEKLFGEVKNYIDEHYVQSHRDRTFLEFNEKVLSDSATMPFEHRKSADTVSEFKDTLEDVVNNLDEPFSVTLLRLIDMKGKTDVEVYKKANIDRKLFSKIRTGKGYMPGKRTILALAVALELNLEETKDLLKRAGYALSNSKIFDVIVEYFILHGKYNIYEINEVLFKYDQALLGS